MSGSTVANAVVRVAAGCEVEPSGADRALLAAFLGGDREAAFARIVQRHGAMVFGACQRLLGDRHDAEDAFQATFLILARKARSIARPEALGGLEPSQAARLTLPFGLAMED